MCWFDIRLVYFSKRLLRYISAFNGAPLPQVPVPLFTLSVCLGRRIWWLGGRRCGEEGGLWLFIEGMGSREEQRCVKIESEVNGWIASSMVSAEA
jgi:hypothetical protein